MATINLTANGNDEELVLAYLQENSSDILAEKINNGTPYEKDGKQLVNKKDLSGFISFACDEAKKLAKQGAKSAPVHSDIVFGWAIHYFEEDSIVGKLYNQDGTEYKPPAPIKKATTPLAKPTPPPKPKAQFSFFDMLNEKKDEQETTMTVQADEHEVVDSAVQQADDNPVVEQKQTPKPTHTPPPIQQPPKPKNEFYEKYMTYVNRYPDSVIAMRVGDFYEVFGKRATEIADEVNLTLTGRDLGLEQRTPMVGFPHHSAERYFMKLRRKHSVVVVDPDGERKLPEFSIEDLLDESDYLTDEEKRMYDEDDELTPEFMRQFDGDITEPKDIHEPTPANEQPTATCEPINDSDSHYDEAALAKIVKLLGDSIILR